MGEAERIAKWKERAVLAAIRGVPPVHIIDTTYVPSARRRPDAIVDRARVLIDVQRALHWPGEFAPEEEQGA